MEKLQDRRNFLKKVSVMAGLSQLSLMGWSSGFSTMVTEGLKPTSEFSLLKLEKLLSGYLFPFIDKFSTNTFSSKYNLYNLYGNNAVFAGEFHMNSKIKEKSQWFNFLIWRLANNGIQKKDQKFRYTVSGDVMCKSDPTFSPENWNVSSRIAISEDGGAFGGTELRKKGEINRGEISFHLGNKIIRKSTGTLPLSWKWGLVAVVQEMAKESLNELQFSTLDEFDNIYKNQKLRYRRKVALDCGKDQLIDFKVFELTGDGVIPAVYWVDNLNRTLFVITGMEAFVLE
jgi:hypothetical protein